MTGDTYDEALLASALATPMDVALTAAQAAALHAAMAEAAAKRKTERQTWPRFNASRGGHAPGHLRDMLVGYIQTGKVSLEELSRPLPEGTDPLRWLTGQLWNCTDTLPAEVVQDLEDLGVEMSTRSYGVAVRHLRGHPLPLSETGARS